jgi:excisionase family DNA binding protein
MSACKKLDASAEPSRPLVRLYRGYLEETGSEVAAAIFALDAFRHHQQTDAPAPAADTPLTVQQAAKRFNVSARTLYALCNERKLPHSRVGTGRGTIRIMPSDLKEYLRQSQQGEVDYLS